MEKLLQLLNEYRLEKGMSEYTKYISETGYFTRKSYFYEHYSWVISKKFGFIQWLVEERKVEWFLIPEIIKKVEVDSSGLHDYNEYYENFESLLMHLSIQDDPIEFLVSILK